MTKNKPSAVNAEEVLGSGIVLRGPFPESQIPSRTRPMEYYDDLKSALAKLSNPSDAIELDNQKITESRLRRYLRLLAQEDESYKVFKYRTAPNKEGKNGRTTGGRRRLFVVRGVVS